MHEGASYEIGPCSSGQEADLVCAALKGVEGWSCMLCDRLAACLRSSLEARPRPPASARLLTLPPPCPASFLLLQPRRQARRTVQQAGQI